VLSLKALNVQGMPIDHAIADCKVSLPCSLPLLQHVIPMHWQMASTRMHSDQKWSSHEQITDCCRAGDSMVLRRDFREAL
jgi:hypothetical protein